MRLLQEERVCFYTRETLKSSFSIGMGPKRTIQEMCKDGWNWQVKNPLGIKLQKSKNFNQIFLFDFHLYNFLELINPFFKLVFATNLVI